MQASLRISRVLFTIAFLLLLALSWTGLYGGVDQFPGAETSGQKLQAVAQFAYGAFSVASLGALLWVRQWPSVFVMGWALSLTVAGGLAPVVWGDGSVAIGVLSGGATLLIAFGIIWLARTGARGLTRA